MVGWKQCQGLHVFTANPIIGALFLPRGLELKHPFHQPSRGISQRHPAGGHRAQLRFTKHVARKERFRNTNYQDRIKKINFEQ